MALNNRSQLIPSPPLHDLTIMIEDSDGAVSGILGFRKCGPGLVNEPIAGRALHDRGATLHDPVSLVGDCRALARGGPMRCYIAKASELGQSVILQF
jgi:hypothetical protein